MSTSGVAAVKAAAGGADLFPWISKIKSNYLSICLAVIFIAILCKLGDLLSLAFREIDPIYWQIYNTSGDVQLVTASIAVAVLISPKFIRAKISAICFMLWFIGVAITNGAKEIGLVDIPNNSLWIYFGSMFLIILFAFLRFPLKGLTNPKRAEIEEGNLYLVIGKPADFVQFLTAIYTKKGAWFGITDGESIWEYDKVANGLVKVPYREGYTLGRGVELICAKDPLKLHYLESRVGDVYSTFNSDKNCIGLLEIAKRWQDEVRQGGRNEG